MNTLAHKLEIMRRNSKQSPEFYVKAHCSILKPDSSLIQQQKLVSTPSIPMPERFYYEQNPRLLEMKREQIKQRHNGKYSQLVPQVGTGGGNFNTFKRVSSLDHLKVLAKRNAAMSAEIKE